MHFAKLFWNSSSEVWCELHEEAFAYFGGTARTIRFDNLKEGALKPDVYDPAFNLLFAKLLDHYVVIPLPCRRMRPTSGARLNRRSNTRKRRCERTPLREHRRAERALGSLERTLGGHAYPRHQKPGARDVRRRETVSSAAADDAL
jgi:transposase